MKRTLLAGALVVAAVAVAQDVKTLNGAGSTFVAPLFTKIFSEYAKKTGVQVNYQGIGSGGGQRQILARTVDFADSDAFMTDAQLKEAPGKILHVPVAIAPVAVDYNLPGVSQRLKFDGKTLADVFMGSVRMWNDKAIAALNPDVKLPNLPITVVHRSDGSGTTSILVDYLAKVSSDWANKVSKGPQTSVNWPTGIGAQGNPGVAGLVKQTPGAIGYNEVGFAKTNGLSIALIKNASGKVVDPADLKAVAAAASSKPLPADTRVTITNADGSAYPITGFTWMLVYKDQKYGNRSEAEAKALVDLLRYVVTDGQQYNDDLNNGAITDAARTRALAIIDSMTYGGKSLK